MRLLSFRVSFGTASVSSRPSMTGEKPIVTFFLAASISWLVDIARNSARLLTPRDSTHA